MMHVELLATRHPERDLLAGVRRILDDADEAVLCVAFASMAGVQLIRSTATSAPPRENDSR